MKILFPLFLALVVLAGESCKKKTETPPDPVSPEIKAQAAAFTTLLKKENFRLVKYYSETPIDYIDTDQVVKAETELWNYVSIWLKDDTYSFKSDGTVDVEQNTDRIPTDSTTAVLNRNYSVVPDKDGVAFKFLGHEYQTLDYRLVSFTDSSLLIWATWNGNKVFSEFKKTD